MPVALYMNHNVDRAVTDGVRLRGVDVLTAFENGAHKLEDDDLLDRALSRGRVLYTNDVDLVVEARHRQRTGQPFAGVVYVHQGSLGIGRQIEELELVAKTAESEELANTLLFLPVS